MRLRKHNRSNHRRANTGAPIVQTPNMARRPRPGKPAETLVMAAVPPADSGDYLTRELPAVSPAAVLPPYPHTEYTPMSAHPARLSLPAVTQVLPAVRRPVADSTATQVLPRIPDAPAPSAGHVDPTRLYYERTFVEDDGLEPQSRGRHVLADLTSDDDGMPDLVNHADAAPAVQGAYSRVVAAMAPPDSLAGAVRIARRAHAIFVARRRNLVEVESKVDACRRRIAEFNADWDRELRDAQVARHGQRAVVAGEELAAVYEGNRLRIAEENARRAADGEKPLDVTATTFTRGMQAKIQKMLVSEAKAGSAVTR